MLTRAGDDGLAGQIQCKITAGIHGADIQNHAAAYAQRRIFNHTADAIDQARICETLDLRRVHGNRRRLRECAKRRGEQGKAPGRGDQAAPNSAVLPKASQALGQKSGRFFGVHQGRPPCRGRPGT